jgi:predicted small secreted protein
VFVELLPGGTTLRREIQHERNVNMKAFKRVVVALVLVALIGIGALACNTVKGAGKDVEKGGQGIQNAAEGAQRK